MERRASHGESGQAAVEAALTLPLMVFMILGLLQMFMMLQARVMAQYAVFRATRAGSVSHGSCLSMHHAAIGALLPSFSSFLGPATPGGTPAQKLGNAFAMRSNNRFAPALDNGHDGAIVWVIREQPAPFGGSQMTEWDMHQGPPVRLEVRMIYWYPLRIPFIDWVFTRIFLAQWGVLNYVAQNPYLLPEQANWTNESTFLLDPAVRNEMVRRYQLNQFVFPIQATYTMRMMTPPKAGYFSAPMCPP